VRDNGLNMLTTRKLPIWVTPANDNLKYRLDNNLVRLVHDSVRLKHPTLKIGKRFALELALTQWLHSEGMLRERTDIPQLIRDSDGYHE
jgi:hypothetical protein